MASHLTTLGFLVTTEQDFRHYVFQASEFGQKIVSEHGSYTLWTPGRGIELWVQTNVHRKLLGMNPHFSGRARMRMRLTMRIPRYEQSRLDGAFYGWVEARQDDQQAFPLVFDLPDYDTYHDLELPTISMVQLTGFALSVTGYANEEAFRAAQQDSVAKHAIEYISAASFPDAKRRGYGQLPAQAILSGHVLASEMIMNPVTEQRFYWARVRTMGGELDVVADPQVVQGRLVRGGILCGSFWLSGRLL